MWISSRTGWRRGCAGRSRTVGRAGVVADGEGCPDWVGAWVGRTEPAGGAHLVSGEGVAAGEKAVPGRAVAFPVSVPARGEHVVYLRAEDFYRPVFQLEWWPD